jgi:tetratricopeptide (TPR) repeat protein
MARYRLALILASFTVTASLLPFASADNPVSPDDLLDRQVKLQMVLAEGTQLLLTDNNPGKAVEVLEKHLYLIDGNKAYLLLLRDAYKKHVINLYLQNQTEQAQKYLNRLRILDPQSADQLTRNPDAAVTKAGSPSVPNPEPKPLVKLPPLLPGKGPAKEPLADKGGAKPVVRGSMDDDTADPFAPEHAYKAGGKVTGTKTTLAHALLASAETKFNQKKYHEARTLFEQAYQADNKVLAGAGTNDRWAYCKFRLVVDQLNQSTPTRSLDELEAEVKSALALKPNAQISQLGAQLLTQIAQRQGAPAGAVQAVTVAVQHAPQGINGWQVAETSHFRIFHNQSREFVEQVAQIAEQTRVQMSQKWFGATARPWQTKCEIYLHASGKEYSHKTGVHGQSPGHSRIESNDASGEVVARQIELRCDNPDLLPAVLPHETTHVVLAGQFGRHPVPRWVDEGVAVLTEPAHKVSLHLKNLSKFQQQQTLFHVRELIELRDYPHPERIGPFYAQSVSLVDYLTRERGPLVFCKFVQDGLAQGYESALRKHYNIQSYSELQSHWSQHVLANLTPGYVKK